MPEAALGLRERKKLKTRLAIQREGLRLFLEKGFQATTVEEIAEAADISPSTFFNYFRSKEDVVLEDELDPLILTAFEAQPPALGPVAALRVAMKSVLADLTPEQAATMRRRLALITSDSELRSAMLSRFAELVDEVAEVLALKVGGRQPDFAVRNLAGALLGVFMAAVTTAAREPDADLMSLIDAAMAHLEAGLPLEPASRIST